MSSGERPESRLALPVLCRKCGLPRGQRALSRAPNPDNTRGFRLDLPHVGGVRKPGVSSGPLEETPEDGSSRGRPFSPRMKDRAVNTQPRVGPAT